MVDESFPSQVTDAVYAWGYIAKYDKLLKKKIKQDPSTMLILHALFLKFQSFLNVPLQWIVQCQRCAQQSLPNLTI